MMEAFSTFEEIEFVVVFGSRAMGNYKHGSDIDIALKGPQINPGITMRLQRMLNEEVPIPYTVDVVDYAHLEHDGLRNHINEIGIVIYRQQITARESN